MHLLQGVVTVRKEMEWESSRIQIKINGHIVRIMNLGLKSSSCLPRLQSPLPFSPSFLRDLFCHEGIVSYTAQNREQRVSGHAAPRILQRERSEPNHQHQHQHLPPTHLNLCFPSSPSSPIHQHAPKPAPQSPSRPHHPGPLRSAHTVPGVSKQTSKQVITTYRLPQRVPPFPRPSATRESSLVI